MSPKPGGPGSQGGSGSGSESDSGRGDGDAGSGGRRGLQEFLAEAGEILDQLGRDLLALDAQRDQEEDPDLLNAIFRAAHSLKGLSGMFGQDRMAELAHHTEDLLDRVRLGKVRVSPEVVDALVETLDVFQRLLAEASRDEHTDASLERARGMADRLEQLSGGTPTMALDLLDQIGLPPNIRAVLTEYEEHRLRENVRKGQTLWKVRAAFDLADFDQGLTALNQKLKPLGEVISTLPSAEPDGTGIAFDLIFGTKASQENLLAALVGTPATLHPLSEEAPPQLPPAAPAAEKAARKARSKKPKATSVESAPLRPLSLTPDARPSPAPGPNPAPSSSLVPRTESETTLRSLTQTVRVDIGKLDALMNTVGELLLIKGNVQRIAEAVRSGAQVSKLWGQELSREGRQLERKLDELQQGLLEARMVPLGQVFDKLSRLVRRIAREAGKELEFQIHGGEVELDKLIVEELSDPLMHIIRNAIDHGVESPDARGRQGKPRRGTIWLSASQKGNHVVIEVRDDGAGIDVDRVREVALERDLISGREAREMSERDVQNLIFLPGFSTARSVSALSGRGVGLDVVKTNIAHLSGLIDVSSQRGEGTTFTLTMPVTLAIIRALVVSVSGRIYAVPLNSVLEITSVLPSELRTVEKREVLSLRGQTLPFTRLARLFGHPERPVARHYVVVVGLAQDRLGLAVDELLGQQDIVVKPLGGRLHRVRGVSGATDLGNRRTVLVLDVGQLMEEVVSPERRAEPSRSGTLH